jgi:hypothetical protein
MLYLAWSENEELIGWNYVAVMQEEKEICLDMESNIQTRVRTLF